MDSIKHWWFKVNGHTHNDPKWSGHKTRAFQYRFSIALCQLLLSLLADYLCKTIHERHKIGEHTVHRNTHKAVELSYWASLA